MVRSTADLACMASHNWQHSNQWDYTDRAIALKQMFGCKFLYLDGPELYTGGKYSTCIFLVCQDTIQNQWQSAPEVPPLLQAYMFFELNYKIPICRAIIDPGATSSLMLLQQRAMHRCLAGVCNQQAEHVHTYVLQHVHQFAMICHETGVDLPSV